MGDIKGDVGGKSFTEYFNFSVQIKYMLLTLFVLVLFVLFSGAFGIVDFVKDKWIPTESNSCGDGTLYNSCSSVKPYFCLDGKLIDYASVCGCPERFFKRDESCISVYQGNPKEISLNYILRGERNSINFVVYGSFENYISKLSRSIRYSSGEDSSRADFKLKAIDEEEQKNVIMPLVIAIENITNDKEDQMRIAVSIVQNIPFGASNKTSTFGNYTVNYSRYPYEVLYDMEGICGEKTDLLIFLLRGLGYGTGFFYYPTYNHEAVGIKCPVKKSLIDSGYCFVETTGPSIITDNRMSYVGVGKLDSTPEVYGISEGYSLEKDNYEYFDAKQLIRIRDLIEQNEWLGPIRDVVFKRLVERYGLVNEYYSG